MEASDLLLESRRATRSTRVADRHTMINIDIIDARPTHITDELSYNVVVVSLLITTEKLVC